MDLIADFGTTKAGLATVGYTLKDTAGGDVVARTTTGVADLGNGAYGVAVDLPKEATSIKWDTGEVTPVYAHEDLIEAQNNIFLRNRFETVQGASDHAKVYRDDGISVYMEADAFENSQGTKPYAGQGIERRNRLA